MSGSQGTLGSSGGSAMPASRCSASRTCISFCASWASYARSWKRQPPQAGKCAHGASTRSGPGRSTSVASASAWLRLTFVTRARTRSPGKPRRTKTTKPSSRATPLPPYASESTSSSSSSPFATGAAMSGQRRDEDLALARAVELAEEDALVGAEREAPFAQRDEHLRARGERGACVRRRVRPVLVVMAPVPIVADDALERVLEIGHELRVDPLVDRDARGRMGN